jgi:hypothetical protein
MIETKYAPRVSPVNIVANANEDRKEKRLTEAEVADQISAKPLAV